MPFVVVAAVAPVKPAAKPATKVAAKKPAPVAAKKPIVAAKPVAKPATMVAKKPTIVAKKPIVASKKPSSATKVASARKAKADDDQALPFAPRPAWLDGSLPGDRAFDPFALAKPAEYLQMDLDRLDQNAAKNPSGRVIGKLKKVDNKPQARTIVVGLIFVYLFHFGAFALRRSRATGASEGNRAIARSRCVSRVDTSRIAIERDDLGGVYG